MDPRFEGDARVRYVYMSYCNDEGVSGSPPRGWLRWDRHTGEQLKWLAPPGCFCEEVVLIPKRRVDGGGGAEAAAEEDVADAWVAAMMFDSRRNASCLCILDAARICVADNLPLEIGAAHGSVWALSEATTCLRSGPLRRYPELQIERALADLD